MMTTLWKLNLTKSLILCLSLSPVSSFAIGAGTYGGCGVQPSAYEGVSELLQQVRIIGTWDRTTELTDEERELFKGLARIRNRANAVLLDNCKTVLTAAHVSEVHKTGELRRDSRTIDPDGKQKNRLRLKDKVVANAVSNRHESDFLNLEDWNVLELAETAEGCHGVEAAIVSKRKLKELGGKLYSFAFLPPGASPDEVVKLPPGQIVDYVPTVHRNCNFIDEDEINPNRHKDLQPTKYERAEMLYYDCDTAGGTSGHGIFTKIDGKFYLIGIHGGPGQFVCSEEPHKELPATDCPNEAKWITGKFAEAIEKSLGRPLKRFE